MLSLLGAALGFGTSVLPSVIDLFQQRQKDAQELKMLEAKGKYAAQLSSLKLDELESKADIAETEGIYASMRAANAKSGFAAALSGSVRPVITYLFVGFFLVVQITSLMYAMNNGADFRDALNEVWSQDVNLLFTSIISFWFGSRQFAKLRNNSK
jgi:hypothetical protein|tara:strand:+ start:1275 stop:1739 length:465 start_codon:yes stop_codon:yes gene_type:complete